MARLIDADKWIEKLTKVINDDEAPGELKDYNLMLINEISAEPTAYDPEKVIKELEAEKFELDCRYDVDLNTTIDDAIKIVKKGGIE